MAWPTCFQNDVSKSARPFFWSAAFYGLAAVLFWFFVWKGVGASIGYGLQPGEQAVIGVSVFWSKAAGGLVDAAAAAANSSSFRCAALLSRSVRGGDALVRWLEKSKPPMHWQGEAGTRLAEIGDARAAKYLGERMKADPLKLYQLSKFWEADEGGHLSRTDLPRVVATRMLADLAVMRPDKRDELKAGAEDAVLAWIKDRPQPHANGLRFRAFDSAGAEVAFYQTWARRAGDPFYAAPASGGTPATSEGRPAAFSRNCSRCAQVSAASTWGLSWPSAFSARMPIAVVSGSALNVPAGYS